MRYRIPDMTGAKIGRWLLLKDSKVVHGYIHYKCRCACGTEKFIRLAALLWGNSWSCGCYQREIVKSRFGTGPNIDAEAKFKKVFLSTKGFKRVKDFDLDVIFPVSEEREPADCRLLDVRDDSSPEELALFGETKDILSDIMLSTLTDREYRVLVLRFGLDGNGVRTLEDVGRDRLVARGRDCISRERVRQFEHKALRSVFKKFMRRYGENPVSVLMVR